LGLWTSTSRTVGAHPVSRANSTIASSPCELTADAGLSSSIISKSISGTVVFQGPCRPSSTSGEQTSNVTGAQRQGERTGMRRFLFFFFAALWRAGGWPDNLSATLNKRELEFVLRPQIGTYKVEDSIWCDYVFSARRGSRCRGQAETSSRFREGNYQQESGRIKAGR